MDSKRFKRKKFAPSHINSKLPELLNDKPYIGIYNRHNVTVVEKYAIHDIYNEGNFGKGSLSKSAPNREIAGDVPEVLMLQQWENRLKWKEVFKTIRYEDKIYSDSIQNLLDSPCCDGESWKKWKDSGIGGSSTTCEKRAEMNAILSGVSNETKNDPLSNMVEEILHTGKVKGGKSCAEENIKTVLVVEDSGSGSATYEDFSLSNIKVKLKENVPYIKEVLKLSLVEAFFLKFAVGRLKIINEDGTTMNNADLWIEFLQAQENFISKYVAYHHYRSLGWTVRSGIKFGGDYLLYKIGPAYYHASYLVWLVDKKKKKRMSWSEFVALNRLVETYNKDLLLCEILDSHTVDDDSSSPNVLRKFSVLEVVPKRWIPSQERI